MKDWKQAERNIARLLGGRRVPVSGRQRGFPDGVPPPDIEHPVLSIEVKSRNQLPRWLEDALRQAELSATEGRLPVAVLHEDRRRYRDGLVLLRLGDFVDQVLPTLSLATVRPVRKGEDKRA